MKVKLLVCWGLTVVGILTAGELLPSSAQSEFTTKQSRQTLQRLANGNYFYGTTRSPYRTGNNYLIFRKTGSRITGMKYPVPGETTCFRGMASGNRITDVTIRLEPLGGGTSSFSPRDPINAGSYNRIEFNRSPDFARRGLQECIRVFANRR